MAVVAALILSALACDASSIPDPGALLTQQSPATIQPTDSVTQPPEDLPTESAGTPTHIPTIVPTDLPLGTATAAPLPPTATGPAGDHALVTRIVDGDTIKASLNGSEVTIRYIGVNTPETDQACYAEATAANQSLVSGQTVTLVKDVSETDQYGRLLRYVYLGATMVNAELARQGWAEAAKYPPDVAHADEFHSLAMAARASNLGCWPTGVFGPPISGGERITGTPPSGVVCECGYNAYNCNDFSSRAEAQACFDYCKAQGAGDVHLMDGNSNGLACENLP
jgi:endonuclease YncB( thermonuclease family)